MEAVDARVFRITPFAVPALPLGPLCVRVLLPLPLPGARHRKVGRPLEAVVHDTLLAFVPLQLLPLLFGPCFMGVQWFPLRSRLFAGGLLMTFIVAVAPPLPGEVVRPPNLRVGVLTARAALLVVARVPKTFGAVRALFTGPRPPHPLLTRMRQLLLPPLVIGGRSDGLHEKAVGAFDVAE